MQTARGAISRGEASTAKRYPNAMTRDTDEVKMSDETERPLKPHEVILIASIQGATGSVTCGKFAGVDEGDISKLAVGLMKQTEEIRKGDLSEIEAKLFAQASTLETLFTSLLRRATNQEYLDQFKAHMTLALRAQAQSRATPETLAEMKSPKHVAFIRQANVANNQQVNNGDPRAQEPEKPQTELLEVIDGNYLDTGATAAAGRGDLQVATVGSVDGAED